MSFSVLAMTVMISSREVEVPPSELAKLKYAQARAAVIG